MNKDDREVWLGRPRAYDCAQVLQEVQDLQEGLKETVKAVAEELNVKTALINKAIKVAHKGDWHKVADEFEDLETLVATVGKDK